MLAVRCRKCGVVVRHDEKHLNGCGCDPDAPSWIAIGKDGRMVKMSDANYEEVE